MSSQDDEAVAAENSKLLDRRAVWERPALRRLASRDAESMVSPPPDSGNNSMS